jgi:hypothetical protein
MPTPRRTRNLIKPHVGKGEEPANQRLRVVVNSLRLRRVAP